MSTCFQNKEKRHWALERPKLDNASVVPGPGRVFLNLPRLSAVALGPVSLKGKEAREARGGLVARVEPEVREDLTLCLQWKRCGGDSC